VQRVALDGNQVDVVQHHAVHVPCAVGQGLDGVAVGVVRVNLHHLQEYEQIRQLARL
jgi:D-serine dehydratase